MSHQPNMYDSHMHTPLCKHARGEPQDYAKEAERKGLKGIIFTCHSPMPFGWNPKIRMSINQFDEYVDMVQQARDEYAGRVDVRLGLESDFIPGMESWLEELHQKADFHYILGSVHPQTDEYKLIYLTGHTRLEYEQSYFENLANAAESGLYDCLSHPDIVKIVHAQQYKVSDHMDTIKRSLDRIAKTGIAMELNTSGVNKAYKEINPGMEILGEMVKRDIPVVLGSDSHDAHRVSADFDKALQKLQSVGYTTVNYFLNRERQELAIEDVFLTTLQPRLV
jgi:histidinol-phosphatase (PHP family)